MPEAITSIGISVMTIGKTPSNFDPKYNGQIKRVSRSIIGLAEIENESQLCVVFELPKPDGEVKYGYCGMTPNELKSLEKGISTMNPGGDKFNLVWDDRYASCNQEALKSMTEELNASEV